MRFTRVFLSCDRLLMQKGSGFSVFLSRWMQAPVRQTVSLSEPRHRSCAGVHAFAAHEQMFE